MYNEEKQKRRFQFHLSTMLMMTIIASGCMWKNAHSYVGLDLPLFLPTSYDKMWYRGFPFTYSQVPLNETGIVGTRIDGSAAFSRLALGLDILACVLLTFLVGAVWEWIVFAPNRKQDVAQILES